MDKELALAFNFKDAPKEVQEAGLLHQANWLRLEKAVDQLDKWKREKVDAQAVYDKSLVAFRQAIDAWDPVAKANPVPEEFSTAKAKK